MQKAVRAFAVRACSNLVPSSSAESKYISVG
jgi:hypothetical protein